jgi:hypothetical protein
VVVVVAVVKEIDGGEGQVVVVVVKDGKERGREGERERGTKEGMGRGRTEGRKDAVSKGTNVEREERPPKEREWRR